MCGFLSAWDYFCSYAGLYQWFAPAIPIVHIRGSRVVPVPKVVSVPVLH
jgi:hypothetical protein